MIIETRMPYMKQELKKIHFIRNNYRRTRKIFLHLISGRFKDAIDLLNHYNPVYRILFRTSYRLHKMQSKKLEEAVEEYYDLPDNSFNDKNIKLGIIARDIDYHPKSSTFIRLISPLTVKVLEPEVGVKFLTLKNLKKNNDLDVLIVQRTALNSLKEARKLIDQTKNASIKLVVDNDDAFDKIGKSHPEYNLQLKRREALNYLMEHSDEIWVSTELLVLPQYKNRSFVMENSLDKRLWKTDKIMAKDKKTYKNVLSMVYMGTATHDADFKMILPDLDRVNAKNPGSFMLTSIGVSSDLPDRPWIQQISPPRFHSLYPLFVKWFLNQEKYDLGLSPLLDSEFNRSKSDIKCLDYLAIGSTPIVSDLEPYQHSDLEEYIIKVQNKPGEWYEEIMDIINKKKKFRENMKGRNINAHKYVFSERSSELIGVRMLENLVKLLNKS